MLCLIHSFIYFQLGLFDSRRADLALNAVYWTITCEVYLRWITIGSRKLWHYQRYYSNKKAHTAQFAHRVTLILAVVCSVGVLVCYMAFDLDPDGYEVTWLRFWLSFPVWRLLLLFHNVRHLIHCIGLVLPTFGNLIALLFLFMYCFSYLGMTLFAGEFDILALTGDEPPGNFDTFYYAVLSCFHILWDGWNDYMWAGVKVSGWYVAPLFCLYSIICSTIMANVFTGAILSIYQLAVKMPDPTLKRIKHQILLEAVGEEDVDFEDDEENKNDSATNEKQTEHKEEKQERKGKTSVAAAEHIELQPVRNGNSTSPSSAHFKPSSSSSPSSGGAIAVNRDQETHEKKEKMTDTDTDTTLDTAAATTQDNAVPVNSDHHTDEKEKTPQTNIIAAATGQHYAATAKTQDDDAAMDQDDGKLEHPRDTDTNAEEVDAVEADAANGSDGEQTKKKEEEEADDEPLPEGWSIAVDDESGDHYYQCISTGQSTWERSEIPALIAEAKQTGHPASEDSRVPPDGWVRIVHDDGSTYYENVELHMSVWELEDIPGYKSS